MAPYPTAIIKALYTAAHLGTQKEPHRAGKDEFEALSKSKRQRWIRTLKGFCAHLRSCMEALYPEAIVSIHGVGARYLQTEASQAALKVQDGPRGKCCGGQHPQP
jgi:hypothetical protein